MANSKIFKGLEVRIKDVRFTYANYGLWYHDAEGFILGCQDTTVMVTQTIPSEGAYARLFDLPNATNKSSSESPYTAKCYVLEY